MSIVDPDVGFPELNLNFWVGMCLFWTRELRLSKNTKISHLLKVTRKGLFTPNKSWSKNDKDQRTSKKKIKKWTTNIKENFRISFRFRLVWTQLKREELKPLALRIQFHLVNKISHTFSRAVLELNRNFKKEKQTRFQTIVSMFLCDFEHFYWCSRKFRKWDFCVISNGISNGYHSKL